VRSIFTPRFRRVWLGNFFSDFSFALFFQFPGFLAGLGAREAVIGATASVAAIAAILARPRAGHWMDAHGRIPVVRLASFIRLAAIGGFLLVRDVGPTVYVARAAYTVGLTITFTGLFTYAADVIPADRRSQAIAYYGLSGMAAAAIGPAVGAARVARYGHGGVFVGMAVAEVGLLLVLYTLRAVENRPKIAVEGSVLRLVRYGPLVPIWVMMLGFGLGYGGLVNFMRTFVDATGIGQVGPFFAVYATTAIIVRLTLSSLPDRWGEARISYLAAAVFAAGIGMLAVAATAWQLALFAVLAGTGHAFLFPALSSLVVARAPVERRGTAMSLYTSMFDLGPLAGAPLLGLVAERWGYAAMWPTVGASIALAAVGFFVLDRRPRTLVTSHG
jgi:MFS family permease